MYQQVFDPVTESLAFSSLFAALPLITLFVLLGGLRWPAQWAGLTALVYEQVLDPVGGSV